MNSQKEQIIHVLKQEEYLAQFLDTSESEPLKDVNFIVSHSLSVSEQLSKLSKGITLLEKEVENIVFENHDELASECLWLDQFESRLSVLKEQLKHTSVLADALRTKTAEPYDKIKLQYETFTRLYDTSNILRCVIFLQQSVENFPRNDLVKASIVVREVDDELQDVDLNDLDIVENDLHFMKSERLKLQRSAQQMFSSGIEQLNRVQITTSICILGNLRTLKQVLDEFLQDSITAIERNTESSLNTQTFNQNSDKSEGEKLSKNIGPGKITGGTFPGISVSNFRSMLWNNWSNLLENVIYPKCEQIFVLHLALCGSDVSRIVAECLKISTDKIGIAHEYWNKISEILSKKLIDSAQSSSFIKPALEGGYPKLLRLHIDLDRKLQKLCGSDYSNENYPFPFKNHFAEPFENAYLSRSLSRLVNNVESMFSANEFPTNEMVDSFTNIIIGELTVSAVNSGLNSSVVRNIDKALRLFYLKCEQLMILEGNYTQVIDPPNENQKINVHVVNLIYYLQQQLNSSLNNANSTEIPTNSVLKIKESLNSLDNIVNNILCQLCISICEVVESIILTIHEEDFARNINTPSLYMKELRAFVERATRDYLKPFNHSTLLQKCYKSVAVKCIELFLRHVALIRPLNELGRKKLVADFNQMESVIFQLCEHPNELGRMYKIFKSFSKVIMLEPEQLTDCELIGNIVPYSLILMYMFSYAPEDMLSPHQCCNWSIARLSQWLDNHVSETERLELIKGSLNYYEQTVQNQNKSFHGIYHIMTKIFKAATLQTK